MNVIIFDKTGDSDPTNVGVITCAPNVDLNAEAAKVLPAGTAYEIVDDSILPWDQPRETWEWVEWGFK